MSSTTIAHPGSARAESPTPAPYKAPRRFWRRLPIRILITVLLIIEIYPIVWLLIGSFKTQSEVLNDPFWSLPHHPNLDNYRDAFTTGGLGTYIRNSVIAVFPSLFLTLLFGVAGAFALEVMVFKGRAAILLAFLFGIMVPGQMILLPLFRIYLQTGLSGSLWPLIITYTATGLPLTVFMMATYFRAIPREILEAATLDGASTLGIFWRIGFPLARNAVFTVALVQFFFIWNDLLISLTFTTDDNLRTVQVGLLNFTGQYGETAYGPLFAAISINVVGALVLYLLINQRIIKGMTAGAVKG